MTRERRKILAVFALVLGLPLWIVLAVSLVGMLGRPPFLVELAIYAAAGICWALPLKPLFKGIGRE